MTTTMKTATNILVGICSCAGARARREAVRRTWLSRESPGIVCRFFLGGPDPLPPGESEHAVLLDAPDGYNELPAKVFAFFRYALEHFDFEWLFKCDDDTYLDLDRLPELATPGCELIGDTMVEARSAPSGGAGYFLSRSMVEKIAALPALPISGAEDLIVGRLVSQLGGSMKATGRLSMDHASFPDAVNDMVSAHWCSPAVMEAIHTLRARKPDEVLAAEHPFWKDDLLFYSGGLFRRKSTCCHGRWEVQDGGSLALLWERWPSEQLLRRGDAYVGSQTILRSRNGGPLPDMPGVCPEGDASRPSFARTGPLRIHLACGERRFPGWVNLDAPNYRIDRPLPWKDGEADAYYLEYGLERLSPRSCCSFFREVWRTLRWGGVLRLVFIDIRLFALRQTPALLQFLRQRKSEAPPGSGAVETLLHSESHESLWTKESMECLLREIGFTVVEQKPGDSSEPALQGLERLKNDENPFELLGTVCLEARKERASTLEATPASASLEAAAAPRFVTPRFGAGQRTGNRLFQIAAVYAHALRHGLACRIPWRCGKEANELFHFLGEDAAPCPAGGQGEPVVYREPSFSYRPIPATVTHGAIEGYFQSERYFADCEAEIRALFRRLTAPKREGCAGVHLRRGDYLRRKKMYHSPDAAFLSAALGKLSAGIRELVIFSDEPEEARALVASLPEARRFELSVDRHPALEALREMTAMQELILSCSTFSWWGAWLGRPETVLIQKRWFAGFIADDQDVYCPAWIRI